MSIGAITDNLLGAALGVGAIPKGWLAGLELRDVIEELASDLLDCRNWGRADISDELWRKYPGF